MLRAGDAEAEAAGGGATQVDALPPPNKEGGTAGRGDEEPESASAAAAAAAAVGPRPRELPRPPERVLSDYDDDDDDDAGGNEALEEQRLRALLPRLPGMVGTPWAWRLPRATSAGGGAEAKAERTREVIMRMIDRNERQQMLFLWRLNATRAKASALAVWAVDQGNRKAYEVERALMAENSWATRSVIWEGYRHSPLVGVTDSCWFWSAKADEGMSVERMREELKMSRQRTAFLSSQLDTARQQLVDWQEVADFQSMDGTWQSMRLRESERQVLSRVHAARCVASATLSLICPCSLSAAAARRARRAPRDPRPRPCALWRSLHARRACQPKVRCAGRDRRAALQPPELDDGVPGARTRTHAGTRTRALACTHTRAHTHTHTHRDPRPQRLSPELQATDFLPRGCGGRSRVTARSGPRYQACRDSQRAQLRRRPPRRGQHALRPRATSRHAQSNPME